MFINFGDHVITNANLTKLDKDLIVQIQKYSLVIGIM